MSKNVTVNGVDYKGVSQVQLPATAGGTALFKDVDEITTPSGTINITENGTHNVSAYAQAVVNVVASGGDEDTAEFAKLMAGGYRESITAGKVFKFPTDVTVIRAYAFNDVIPVGGEIADVILPDTIERIEKNAFYYANRIRIGKLPENLKHFGGGINYADALFGDNTVLEIPAGVESIPEFMFFQYYGKVNTLTFKGTPTSIPANAFSTSITTINVPWSEGDVANAPWGATTATINYNYNGEL